MLGSVWNVSNFLGDLINPPTLRLRGLTSKCDREPRAFAECERALGIFPLGTGIGDAAGPCFRAEDEEFED